MSSRAAQPDPPAPALTRPSALVLRRLGGAMAVALAVAVALTTISFAAGGGLTLRPNTFVQMALILGGAAALAAAALALPAGAPLRGAPTLLALAGLAGLSGLSILWSVQPAESWLEANRSLGYAGTFAIALVLARVAPNRWDGMLAGIGVAGVVVCTYALLTKVFPGALNPSEIYARLREPYGYWNAVGLTAALAIPPFLWLGSRRDGHAALTALAFPAIGLLLVTLMLAYSRGALLALAAGCAFWFATTPRRLRGCAVLAVSGAGAGAVTAWAFSQSALTSDRVAIGLRADAGHQLGVAMVAMLILLLIAGLVVGFLAARTTLSDYQRRRAGRAILVGLALVPVAVTGALAMSSRGLGGSVSNGWRSLTDPHASTPPNDPGRLTAVGSVRARYWNEALKIFEDHRLKGVGAGGYATARPRYRQDTLDVRHAHGYAVQIVADLGLLGLAISLVALVLWLDAAVAATGLRGPPASNPSDRRERTGLLTLFAIVVVFGVHSFIDWTWFIPGNACVALLCAGWLAGRGPAGRDLDMPVTLPRALRSLERWRLAGAAGILLAGLVLVWAAWQPVRSVDAGNAALAALEDQDIRAAREHAIAAANRNPLSIEPLFDRAAIESAAGIRPEALAALQRAVRLQPSNPETWLMLGQYELDEMRRPAQALSAFGAALYLDPRSNRATAAFLAAQRAEAQPRTATP